MSEENANNDVTIEQILAKLNDPETLRMVMAAKGIGTSKPQDATKPAKKSLEKPTINIPEDADLPGIIKALNEFLPKVVAYNEDVVGERVDSVETKVRDSEASKFQRVIEEFKAKVGVDNFAKAMKIMVPLYDSGKHTLEESYTIAAKSMGLENPFDTSAKKRPSVSSATANESKAIPQVKTSSNNSPKLEKLDDKPVSIKDAVAKNFEALTAELEDGGKSLIGGD